MSSIADYAPYNHTHGIEPVLVSQVVEERDREWDNFAAALVLSPAISASTSLLHRFTSSASFSSIAAAAAATAPSVLAAGGDSSSSLWMVGDRYQVGGEIGSGAYSTVHFAVDSFTGDTVSVKVLNCKQRGFSKDRVNQEISILERLSHSNPKYCVKILGHFEDKNNVINSGTMGRCGSSFFFDDDMNNERVGNLYIVQEYVHGKNLQSLIDDKGSIPSSECKSWFRQFALALAECHAAGIYHRDLKPANIIISANLQNVKVVDFGSAAYSPVDGMVGTQSVGSPAITPPEIASCSTENATVNGELLDVWGLGVTLFMMLVGRPPFTGGSIFELYQNISTGQVEIPEHLDEEVSDLLRKMLAPVSKRIDINHILCHPWISDTQVPNSPPQSANVVSSVKMIVSTSQACTIL